MLSKSMKNHRMLVTTKPHIEQTMNSMKFRITQTVI